MSNRHFYTGWFVSLSLFLCCFLIFSTTVEAQDKKKIKLTFSGKLYSSEDNSELEGVVLELKKGGKLMKSMSSSRSGKYEFVLEISSTDDPDAEYELSFSKTGLLSKNLEINTYVPNPNSTAYAFRLDVNMAKKKKEDIVINLASGKVRWSENKFILDKIDANVIQKVKEEESKKKKTEEEAKPPTTSKVVEKEEPKKVVKAEKKANEEKIVKQKQDSLLQKYSKGVSVEMFQEANFKLIKKIVVKNGKAIVYYKKIWNWGGVYCFVEDLSMVRSISEYAFDMAGTNTK